VSQFFVAVAAAASLPCQRSSWAIKYERTNVVCYKSIFWFAHRDRGDKRKNNEGLSFLGILDPNSENSEPARSIVRGWPMVASSRSWFPCRTQTPRQPVNDVRPSRSTFQWIVTAARKRVLLNDGVFSVVCDFGSCTQTRVSSNRRTSSHGWLQTAPSSFR
jgi:hypothetical protein